MDIYETMFLPRLPGFLKLAGAGEGHLVTFFGGADWIGSEKQNTSSPSPSLSVAVHWVNQRGMGELGCLMEGLTKRDYDPERTPSNMKNMVITSASLREMNKDCLFFFHKEKQIL